MREAPSRAADLVLTGRFESHEQQTYRHLPFAMPPGVTQIHIAYDYSDRIPSTPGLPAAIPSISDCLTNRAMRPAHLASAGGAGATSTALPWAGIGPPRHTARERSNPGNLVRSARSVQSWPERA